MYNKLDYEKENLLQIERNILDLRKKISRNPLKELSDKQMERKIKNFCIKFNLEENFVKNRIINDDLFVLNFIKDPSKQSLHQSLALAYLKQKFNNIKLLNSKGEGSKYISAGQIILGENLTTKDPGKSIDFEWTFESEDKKIYTCYATHKYTKEEGGSQDNQFKDVKNFCENAAKSNSKNILFFAICDGAYYLKEHSGSSSRIEYLNDNYSTRNNNITAIQINDIFNYFDNNLK